MLKLYIEERNADFYSVCKKVIESDNEGLNNSQVAACAALLPAKSFYLMPRQIKYIISNDKLPVGSVQQTKYLHIRKLARELLTTDPSLTIAQLANIIAEHEAPSFYLQPKYAAVLFYSLLKMPPRLI
jgi:hypothetical protein